MVKKLVFVSIPSPLDGRIPAFHPPPCSAMARAGESGELLALSRCLSVARIA